MCVKYRGSVIDFRLVAVRMKLILCLRLNYFCFFFNFFSELCASKLLLYVCVLLHYASNTMLMEAAEWFILVLVVMREL